MSSDYFPSNEEPWWSSADARAVSVAADPARKQRLPPSGYDLPFCCHLLSLLDFSSHKTIARGAWRKATSALRLPALGDDDAMWDKLLLLYDPDASGEIQVAELEASLPMDRHLNLLLRTILRTVTALAEGAQSSQDVKLARVQLERTRTICRPVLEAWRAEVRRSRALKAKALRRMRLAGCARAWSAWGELVRERAMLKQYAKRLMMREAAGCFRKWREAAAMGKLAQSPQMRRVGLRLLSGKAWAQWADEAAVYKFAKRFVCGRAFRSWASLASPEEAYRRERMAKFCRRLLKRGLYRYFARWELRAAQRAAYGGAHGATAASRTGMRILVGRAWRTWWETWHETKLNATTPALFQGSPALQEQWSSWFGPKPTKPAATAEPAATKPAAPERRNSFFSSAALPGAATAAAAPAKPAAPERRGSWSERALELALEPFAGVAAAPAAATPAAAPFSRVFGGGRSVPPPPPRRPPPRRRPRRPTAPPPPPDDAGGRPPTPPVEGRASPPPSRAARERAATSKPKEPKGARRKTELKLGDAKKGERRPRAAAAEAPATTTGRESKRREARTEKRRGGAT